MRTMGRPAEAALWIGLTGTALISCSSAQAPHGSPAASSSATAEPAASAGPSATGTAAATTADAKKPAPPAPFKVVRATPHRLRPTRVKGRNLAIYRHMLADIDATAVKLDAKLMAGFIGHPTVGPPFQLLQVAGQWPRPMIAAADVAFFGAAFLWSGTRWVAQDPSIIASAKQPHGGSLGPGIWLFDHWLDNSVLMYKVRPFGQGAFSVPIGKSRQLPSLGTLPMPTAEKPCESFLLKSMWSSDAGTLEAQGEELCSDKSQPIRARWTAAEGGKVSLADDLPDPTAIELRPADGRVFASSAKGLWQREEGGGWTQLSLPPVPPHPDGEPLTKPTMMVFDIWNVDGATWASASVFQKISAGTQPDPDSAAYHVVLHSAGTAQLPDDEDVYKRFYTLIKSGGYRFFKLQPYKEWRQIQRY